MSVFLSLQKVKMMKAASAAPSAVSATPAAAARERIIRRAALEFKDGMYGILYLLTNAVKMHQICWLSKC